MAQIGRHPDLGDVRWASAISGIVHLAAQQQLRQHVTQPLADAQLALALVRRGPWPGDEPSRSSFASASAPTARRRARPAAQSVRATCSISYASITSPSRMSL